jgi:phage terminase large subunit
VTKGQETIITKQPKRAGRPKDSRGLTTSQRDFVIAEIAAGSTAREITNLAASRKHDSFVINDKQIAYYRMESGIRIAEIRKQREDAAINTGLAVKANRIQGLLNLARLLEDDIYQNNKLWLTRLRQYGSGRDIQFFEEEEFNEPEVRQIRGLYEDIAKEMGARQREIANNLPEKEAPALLSNPGQFSLPADVIAPDFVNVYRDIRDRKHTEYVLKGGRGSTKSSFASEMVICLLRNNPGMHALATRQVANTMRDSVFSQLQWAVNELGLYDQFKCTVSPLEIEYLPTHQKIYFRGADDPGKMKSIKPAFGYIGILWFEELDQFHGPEAVRKIEQSVIRGGDEAFIFKTFNPPRTSGNWANKYCLIPKESQYQHTSNYLNVPPEWLGATFIEEAEHLKNVNPSAYAHEYLGEVNGTGGQVFDNVKLRKITDAEIKEFDRIHHGLDWGYFPDPFAYVRLHYDAARLKLYIFKEYRAQKKGNRVVWNDLVGKVGVTGQDMLIADSAEPKSIADFRDYGANVRGAEKGPDSVDYSMKWLQSLSEIVIDNERCPYAAQEFIDYELEQDKDGEYISEYPDKNDHFIAATRYGMNLVWRRRGQ